MNENTLGFTQMLAQGDLRSDGLAEEVAREILANPILLPELVDCLNSPDPAIRGHASHALERIARTLPSEMAEFLPVLLHAAQQDDVPMVRWHMAMILGHLAANPHVVEKSWCVLLDMLRDESPFVLCWAISSLCVIARLHPTHAHAILQGISPLLSHPSVSVSGRAKTAVQVITNPEKRLPCGWVKSTHIQV